MIEIGEFEGLKRAMVCKVAGGWVWGKHIAKALSGHVGRSAKGGDPDPVQIQTERRDRGAGRGDPTGCPSYPQRLMESLCWSPR